MGYRRFNMKYPKKTLPKLKVLTKSRLGLFSLSSSLGQRSSFHGGPISGRFLLELSQVVLNESVVALSPVVFRGHEGNVWSVQPLSMRESNLHMHLKHNKDWSCCDYRNPWLLETRRLWNNSCLHLPKGGTSALLQEPIWIPFLCRCAWSKR